MTPEPQEIDNEPPATPEWLEVRPDDRHPHGFEPREQALDAVEVEWDSAGWNAYQARLEAGAVQHDCPGPECHPYPTFDDDPARWGLREPEPMTDAEARAAGEAETWGGRGPSASYAEWLAEGRAETEAEAGG